MITIKLEDGRKLKIDGNPSQEEIDTIVVEATGGPTSPPEQPRKHYQDTANTGVQGSSYNQLQNVSRGEADRARQGQMDYIIKPFLKEAQQLKAKGEEGTVEEIAYRLHQADGASNGIALATLPVSGAFNIGRGLMGVGRAIGSGAAYGFGDSAMEQEIVSGEIDPDKLQNDMLIGGAAGLGGQALSHIGVLKPAFDKVAAKVFGTRDGDALDLIGKNVEANKLYKNVQEEVGRRILGKQDVSSKKALKAGQEETAYIYRTPADQLTDEQKQIKQVLIHSNQEEAPLDLLTYGRGNAATKSLRAVNSAIDTNMPLLSTDSKRSEGLANLLKNSELPTMAQELGIKEAQLGKKQAKASAFHKIADKNLKEGVDKTIKAGQYRQQAEQLGKEADLAQEAAKQKEWTAKMNPLEEVARQKLQSTAGGKAFESAQLADEVEEAASIAEKRLNRATKAAGRAEVEVGDLKKGIKDLKDGTIKASKFLSMAEQFAAKAKRNKDNKKLATGGLGVFDIALTGGTITKAAAGAKATTSVLRKAIQRGSDKIGTAQRLELAKQVAKERGVPLSIAIMIVADQLQD